jgi:hypothetical protein
MARSRQQSWFSDRFCINVRPIPSLQFETDPDISFDFARLPCFSAPCRKRLVSPGSHARRVGGFEVQNAG